MILILFINNLSLFWIFLFQISSVKANGDATKNDPAKICRISLGFNSVIRGFMVCVIGFPDVDHYLNGPIPNRFIFDTYRHGLFGSAILSIKLVEFADYI